MNLGKENEYIEFKETTSELEEAVRDITAILNKRQAGSLYFGLANNGDVIGMNIGKRTESDIASKISNTIEPSFEFEINTKDDLEGKNFIEINFHGDSRPYKCKGIYYYRNGERSEVMPTFILEKFILQRQKDYSAWESETSSCSISDIDEELVKKSMETGNESNKIKHPYINAIDSLKYLHLLDKQGSVNNAGEVLYSKEEPINIRLATYGGGDESICLDMSRVYGNIFTLIEKSFEYVMSRLNYSIKKVDGDLKRKTTSEIPSLAIRELILNIFAHSNYSLPIEPSISIYSNRISFFSPGTFPANATPEEFARKEIDPIDKNTKILKTLYISNYIEHFGTGFTTVFEKLSENKLSYEYRDKRNGFEFTIFRKGEYILNDGDSDYAKVISLIRQDNYIKIDTIASKIGKSRPTVSRIISSLQESNKLSKVGSNKNLKWVLNK